MARSGVLILGREYGPGLWVFVSYSYALVLVMIAVLVRSLRRPDSLHRRRTAVLLAALVVPWSANVLYVFDLWPVLYLDLTPFAFAATGAGLTWMLFRYRFHGIVPVAWKNVVESMEDAVIVLDTDDRVLDLNPAAERLINRRRAEVMGSPAKRAFELRPELLEDCSGSGRRERDITFVDGSVERICEARTLPVCDRHGWIAGRLLAIRDVTANRRVARELEESKRAAEAAALAKSRFLANMSHEIRTPMNGILGMSALLREAQLSPEDAECAQAIRSSAQSLLTILNDILDFSKIEAGRLEIESIAFDLRQVLAEVVRLMEISAREKKIALEFHYAVDAPRGVMGDPGRLRQVILNLVGNAVKFTEAGNVTLDVRSIEKRVRHARVVIAVSDTGIGIPEDKVGLLFQEFSQADSSVARTYGGTGLGLAISRRLVEAMRGTIRLDSRVGKGTTFTVELPMQLPDEDAAPPSKPPDAARVRKSFAGCRILLAEDNPVNQRLGMRVLEKLGCCVDVAGNGAEAIRRAGEAQYALILMDWQMPEVDGLQATIEIRKRGISTPIIALTASVGSETRDACIEAGMNGYLSKPVEPEVWEETLEKWV